MPERRRLTLKHRLWIALLVFLLDRISKLLSVRIPDSGLPLISGIIGLRQARNTGIAFSLFSGSPWLLGFVSLAAIIIIAILIRGMTFPVPAQVGLMLMLGGAVGNMADRFFTGYVPDMIEILFMRFAIFNVADICLCTGCALTILSLLFRKEEG